MFAFVCVCSLFPLCDFQIGDCLQEINSVNVFKKPVTTVAPLMLGPPGTTVRLGFQRRGLVNINYVELTRAPSSVPPGSISAQQYANHLSTNLKTVPDPVRPSPSAQRSAHMYGPGAASTIHSSERSISAVESRQVPISAPPDQMPQGRNIIPN